MEQGRQAVLDGSYTRTIFIRHWRWCSISPFHFRCCWWEPTLSRRRNHAPQMTFRSQSLVMGHSRRWNEDGSETLFSKEFLSTWWKKWNPTLSNLSTFKSCVWLQLRTQWSQRPTDGQTDKRYKRFWKVYTFEADSYVHFRRDMKKMNRMVL